jgi:hypothetical protein
MHGVLDNRDQIRQLQAPESHARKKRVACISQIDDGAADKIPAPLYPQSRR